MEGSMLLQSLAPSTLPLSLGGGGGGCWGSSINFHHVFKLQFPLEGSLWASLKPLVTKINLGKALKLCAHPWKDMKKKTTLGLNNGPPHPACPWRSLVSLSRGKAVFLFCFVLSCFTFNIFELKFWAFFLLISLVFCGFLPLIIWLSLVFFFFWLTHFTGEHLEVQKLHKNKVKMTHYPTPETQPLWISPLVFLCVNEIMQWRVF